MAKFSQTTTLTVNCPLCESEQVIKRGKRNGVQVYGCKSCGRKFRHDMPPNCRASAEVIGAPVNMYYDGLSYKRIAENLADMFDINGPSKATVFEWVRGISALSMSEVEKYKPVRLGTEWVADEMVLPVGGKKLWNWNVMDRDSRYLLASYLSPHRDESAAVEIMRRALKAAGKLPKRIRSDRLASYGPAIDWLGGGKIAHVKSQGITAEIHNNLSERLQGTFRERAKTMRGLQNVRNGPTVP